MKYISLLVLALLQVVLSITLSYKRRSRTSRLFTIFSVSLAVWTFLNVLLDYFQFHVHASVVLLTGLNKAAFFMGILSLVLIYRLTLVFPVEKKTGKIVKILTALGCSFLFTAMLSAVSGTFMYEAGKKVATYSYGPFVPLVGVFGLTLIILGVRNILQTYNKSIDENTRRQAITIFIGLILTIAFALTFITILPLIFTSQIGLVFIGYYAPYIFTIMMIYSIFRQRFLNFRSIVARSMAYLMALVFVGTAYSVIIFYFINRIFFRNISVSWQQGVAYVLFAIFVALTYPKILEFFNRISNNIFYRDAYDPQVFINKLNGILVGTINIGALTDKAARLIETTLKTSSARFILTRTGESVPQLLCFDKNVPQGETISAILNSCASLKSKVTYIDELMLDNVTNKIFEDYDIAVIIRLITRGQQIGYMILGEKKSGNEYDSQDSQLFNIIADQLAIALQNSLRFDEIEHFNDTLQKKVDAATRELRQTNEKLKALDEAKDEFISMASHQLRTPLTSVKGYLSMVLEGDVGKVSGQQRQMLEQAFTSSQRMVYLIADLLNVSRLKTGKFVIESSPTYLPDVIETEMKQLVESAKARNLELTFNKPATFPTLNLDETKTRQVIMNFMDNAIYYTPKGGHIRVELTANDKTVDFKVIDDGLGVPKDEQHHLFTKFYRADNAKKARPDGTGLGLYMAKKVIIAQGGSILFESQENKGSTFGFTFPRKSVETKA